MACHLELDGGSGSLLRRGRCQTPEPLLECPPARPLDDEHVQPGRAGPVKLQLPYFARSTAVNRTS